MERWQTHSASDEGEGREEKYRKRERRERCEKGERERQGKGRGNGQCACIAVSFHGGIEAKKIEIKRREGIEGTLCGIEMTRAYYNVSYSYISRIYYIYIYTRESAGCIYR